MLCKAILVTAALFSLGACTDGPIVSPISGNPLQDAASVIPTGPAKTTVAQGLVDASYNLDQAVIVGALSANDPAPGCLHTTLGQLGISTPTAPVTPAASFTPRVSDLISGGSVLYIRAQQAQALAASGGPQLSISCQALVGKLVIDAGKATAAGTVISGSIAAQMVGLPVLP